MTFPEGKEFMIKKVFTDVLNIGDGEQYSEGKMIRFNIPWEIIICRMNNKMYFALKCVQSSDNWSMETDVKINLLQKETNNFGWKNYVYRKDSYLLLLGGIEFKDVKNYIVDGKLTVEMHVKIKKVTGTIKQKLRSFNDESAKKFSDVVLIVETEKFYVFKMFLASHSSYFESLFMGNFDESKQSEITLKDIDPFDFQDFLELIHGVSDINEDNIEGILKLADMYDSKTSVHRCEKFLIEHSTQSLKQKFHTAIKYKMDELKEKCMTEIKTKDDILSVLPQDVNQMEQSVWAELLHKCISFN